MAGRFSVEAVFNAVDQMTRPVGRMRRNVSRFTRSAEAGFRRMDRRVAGVNRAIRSGLTRGVAALGAILTPTIMATNKLAGENDELAKVTREMEFPIEEFQEWRFVADQGGVSNQLFTRSMQAMQKRMGEARAGTGQMRSVLEKLNPELLDQVMNADSASGALSAYTAAMRETEDPAERAAITSAMFSRAGQDMTRIASMSADQIENLMQRQRENGNVTQEQAEAAEAYNDSVGSLMRAVRGLASDALTPLMVRLTDVSTRAREWLIANRELIAGKINEWMTAIIENIDTIVMWFKRVAIGLAVWFAFVAVLKSVIAVLTLFNLIMLANPITLIVLGVIALIGVLISLGAWLLDVTGVADGFFDGLTIIFDGVVSAGSWMIDQVKAYLSMLGRFWLAVWELISPVATPVFELIADLASWMLGKITHNLGTLSELWNLTWFALTAGPSLAFEIVEAVVGTFVDTITGDWDNIGERWSDLWDSIKEKATTVIDLIQPLIDRVTNSIRAVQAGLGFVGGVLGIGEDDENDGPTPRGNQYGSQGSSPGPPRNRNGQAPPPLLTPQERTAREINETRTTEESVVTIRDETGRAEQERGAGRRNRLNMVRSGNL